MAYNDPVAQIPKVPKEADIRSLLNAPPMPFSDMPRRGRTQKKRGAAKPKKRDPAS